jgi:Icc-related predicted phosphoesterase
MLGRSLVVAPGPLGEGRYAVADLHTRRVEFAELAAPVGSATLDDMEGKPQ